MLKTINPTEPTGKLGTPLRASTFTMSRDCVYNGPTALVHRVQSELAQTKKTICSKKKNVQQKHTRYKTIVLWYILLQFTGTVIDNAAQTCNAAQVTSVTCTNQETRQRHEKYS